MLAVIAANDSSSHFLFDRRLFPHRRRSLRQVTLFPRIVVVMSLLVTRASLCRATTVIVDSDDDVISRMFDVDGSSSSSSSSPSLSAMTGDNSLTAEVGTDDVLLSQRDRHTGHHHHHYHRHINLNSELPQQYPHESISKVKSEAHAAAKAKNDAAFRENGDDENRASKNSDKMNAEPDVESQRRSKKQRLDRLHRHHRQQDPEKNDVFVFGDDKHSTTFEFPSNYAAYKSDKDYASNRIEFYVKNFDDDEEDQKEKKAETVGGGGGGSEISGGDSPIGREAKTDVGVTRQPQVSWGIPDANAAVGAPFRFTIPANAFLGTISSFVISEAGDARLPAWLDFDQKSRTFLGVAGLQDVGQTYISVVALGEGGEDVIKSFNESSSWSSSSPLAKDVFSITVRESIDAPTSYALKVIDSHDKETRPNICNPGEPHTVVSVIVDEIYEKLRPKKKIKLLEKMSLAINVPSEALKILPPSDKRKVYDSSALVAGPGNRKGKKGGVFVQWQIGCGHDFTAENIAMLEQVEKSASNGSLADSLGRDVIGWHVTNQQQTDRAARIKRAPYGWRYTATVEPYRIAPTKASKETKTEAADGEVGPGQRIVPSQPPDALHTRPHGHPHRGPKMYGRHHNKWHKYHATATIYPEMPGVSIGPTPVVQAKATEGTPSYGRGNARERENDGKRPGYLEPSSIAPEREKGPTKSLPDQDVDRKPCKGKKCKPKPQTTSPPTKGPGGGGLPLGKKPAIRKNLGEFECIEGKYCEHQLPPIGRLFKSVEENNYLVNDVSHEPIRVSFLTFDGMSLSDTSWIKYDQQRNMIYGLPLKGEVKPRVMEYVIAAMVSPGNVASDALTVKVVHHPSKINGRKKRSFNHEFVFRFGSDHDTFKTDVELRIRFVRTLASIFGDDASMADIVLTKVKGGSTAVFWSNDSLPFSPCPNDQLKKLKDTVFYSDSSIRDEVIQQMAEAEFILHKVSMTTHGPCSSAEWKPTHVSIQDGRTRSVEAATGIFNDPLFIKLLPAIVLKVILLSAICIACVLYKKSRRGKFTLGEKRTFLNKGIPVIFVDELQENPEPPHTPLILKDEKPPLPPPSYPRSSNGGPASTPPSDHKEPITTADMSDAGDFPPLRDPLTSPNKDGLLTTLGNGNGTLGRGVIPGAAMMNGGPSSQANQTPYRAPPPYVPS